MWRKIFLRNKTPRKDLRMQVFEKVTCHDEEAKNSSGVRLLIWFYLVCNSIANAIPYNFLIYTFLK